jgi:iron complex transport system ATP-binding protein
VTLAATDLSVSYGARVAVRDVSLTAHSGEVLALLGANGSGKSSLLRALAGLVPCRGRVATGGPASAIAYMAQDTVSRAALTAFEVVLLGRMRSLALRVGAADLLAARIALEELGIADMASRRIGELSGGQRQLVFVAQILAADPRIILLDEPTGALDIAHQLHVLQLVRTITKRRGLTTIVVLHDLNAAARFADRIAVMHDGRLVQSGHPLDVLCRATLEPAFRVHVAIDPGSDGHPVVLPLRTRSSGDPS